LVALVPYFFNNFIVLVFIEIAGFKRIVKDVATLSLEERIILGGEWQHH